MWLLQLDLKYYGGKGVAKGGCKRNQREKEKIKRGKVVKMCTRIFNCSWTSSSILHAQPIVGRRVQLLC